MTKEFIEAGKKRLSRDTTQDANRQEINALKRKSEDLKDLVAEVSLNLHRLKKTSALSLDEGHQRMNVDGRPKSFRRLSHPQAPSARFCQSLEYPRATATAGKPDRSKEALTLKGIQAHLGTDFKRCFDHQSSSLNPKTLHNSRVGGLRERNI